jgi:hypothetical protein
MRLTLLTCLGALAATGCEKNSATNEAPSPEPEAPPSEPTAAAEQPLAAGAAGALEVGDPPQVELVEAGTEPRRPLRFKLAAGESTVGEMRLQMAMTIAMDGTQAPSVPLPEMLALMKIDVTRADADGAEYKFEFTKYEPVPGPTIKPEVMTAMRDQLKSLVGTKGTGRIDSRGFNLGVELEIPPGASPQIRQMLDGMRDAIAQAAAPLPAEAVGVGGKWTARMRTRQNGVETDVVSNYAITKLDGDVVETTVSTTLTGVPGPVSNPMLPPGASMTLNEMTGSGSGTMALDLTKAVPSKSMIAVDSKTDATMRMGSQQQRMLMTLALKTKIQQVP